MSIMDSLLSCFYYIFLNYTPEITDLNVPTILFAWLEIFFTNCNPFSSPCEFSTIIMEGIYVPLNTNKKETKSLMSTEVLNIETKYPHSALFIPGDFNNCDFSNQRPKYRQLPGENVGPFLHHK